MRKTTEGRGRNYASDSRRSGTFLSAHLCTRWIIGRGGSVPESLCYRFSSGCATAARARCVFPDNGSAVFRRAFFNRITLGPGVWRVEEKEKKNGTVRTGAAVASDKHRQFFGPWSVHTRAGGNTNAGSYASCAIDLYAGSCLYSNEFGRSRR